MALYAISASEIENHGNTIIEMLYYYTTSAAYVLPKIKIRLKYYAYSDLADHFITR